MPIGRQPLTVLRRSDPVTHGDDGQAVRGPVSEVSVRASVQPVDSFRLQRVPEGLRAERWLVFISSDPLYMASVQLGREPDIILFEGERWQVQQVDAWPTGLIKQWTAYAYAPQTAAVAP